MVPIIKADGRALLLAALSLCATPACAPRGAAGPDGVFCVGATPEQVRRSDHPALLRGSVWAPGPLDLDQSAPAAGALPGERAAAAKIVVRITDPRAPDRAPIETTTDASGRYCAHIDDWSRPLLARALLPSGARRALVVHARGGSIGGASEAMVRLAEASDPLDQWTRERWLVLETVAASALGLLRPDEPSAEGVAPIEWAIRALKEDERVAAALAARAPREAR